jgi:hypothetical protein
MSLTLSTIRAAIGEQLRAFTEREINVDVDGEGKPAPVIRVQLAESDPIDYWQTFGSSGIAEVRFNLVVDPAGVDRSAVIRLDDFLSVGTGNGSSIIDTLMANKTLGDVVETIHMSGVSEYDPDAVTAVLPLRVVCRKQGANA